MKKYEFIAFLVLSMVMVWVSVVSITNIRKPLTGFSKLDGNIQSVDLCDKTSTVLIKGFSYFFHKHHFCISVTNHPKRFIIYAINDKDDAMFKAIAVDDAVTVFFIPQASQDYSEIIQLEKNGKLLYSKAQWNTQQVRSLVAMLLFSIVLLLIGLWGLRKFISNKKRERATGVWSRFFNSKAGRR